MLKTNKCPKCKKYIFGNYCDNCKMDIRDMSYKLDEAVDMLKKIFKMD